MKEFEIAIEQLKLESDYIKTCMEICKEYGFTDIKSFTIRSAMTMIENLKNHVNWDDPLVPDEFIEEVLKGGLG